MGKQKSRFTHPKNWERKKYAKLRILASQTTSLPQQLTTSPQQLATPAHEPGTHTLLPVTSTQLLTASPQQPATPAQKTGTRTLLPITSTQLLTTSPQQPATPAYEAGTRTLLPITSTQLLTTSPYQSTTAAQLSFPASQESVQQTLTIEALRIGLPNENWTILPRADSFQICKFSSSHQPSVLCHVDISSNSEWRLYVHSVQIEKSSIPTLSQLPTKVSASSDLQKILLAVDSLIICPGNEYITFAPIIDSHNGILRDKSGM